MIGEARTPRRLRIARERRGLTLDDIALSLRVDARYLQALESGVRLPFPAVMYAIGFARSYSRVIGVSADDVALAIWDHFSHVA